MKTATVKVLVFLSVFSTSLQLLALDKTVICQNNVDCTQQVQTAIDEVNLSGGGNVYLSSNTGAVTGVLTGAIILKSNVAISGTPQITLRLENVTSSMFTTGGSIANVKLSNFAMRSIGSIQFMIDIKHDFSGLSLADLSYVGDGTRGYFRTKEGGYNLEIARNNVSNIRRFVAIDQPSLRTDKVNKILISKNVVQDMSQGAVQLSGPHNDVTIDGNFFKRHLVNPPIVSDYPSNMISTATEQKDAQGNTISDPLTILNVTNNVVVGVAGVSNVRGPDGKPVNRNGASGDLVAIRYVNKFFFIGNTLQNSGEVGLTISNGANMGTVFDNKFMDIDSSAIVLGSGIDRDPGPAVDYDPPVHGITITGNQFWRFARDFSGLLRVNPNRGSSLFRQASGIEQDKEYMIVTSGNTNFTSIGAASNIRMTVFTATSSGSGTGVAVLNSTKCSFESNGVVTKPGHGFENGARIRFEKEPDAIMPSGLLTTAVYYVVNAQADSFQVATTPIAAPKTFTAVPGKIFAVDYSPTYHALCGIRVWNAIDCSVTSNTIYSTFVMNAGSSGGVYQPKPYEYIASGIWIWSNNLNPVVNLTIGTANSIGTTSITSPNLTSSKIMQSISANGIPVEFTGTVFRPNP